MHQRIAIIDLGTNTFHLLIANWVDNRYVPTYRERLPAKIGMGGINKGIITEEAIARAIDALKTFNNTIKVENVENVFAFGTSALRNASNRSEVTALIRNETGIEVKIISGEEEAMYIYHGVNKAIKIGKTNSLIVDIGGGSVEFIIGNENKVWWKHSFEIGAQRLLERFQNHDPILPSEIENLNYYLGEVLSPLLRVVKEFNPTVLIGSSGTFDTLSDIHCMRNGIPQVPDAAETPLNAESFKKTFAQLLTKNRNERLLVPGMIEMRVDMIITACCLIDFLLDRIYFDSIRVSSHSLKEGVLATMEK